MRASQPFLALIDERESIDSEIRPVGCGSRGPQLVGSQSGATLKIFRRKRNPDGHQKRAGFCEKLIVYDLDDRASVQSLIKELAGVVRRRPSLQARQAMDAADLKHAKSMGLVTTKGGTIYN